jgi:RND family efflux transporter MFP subunit
VTTVQPSRATLRRLTEEPGEIEPFESAAVHAKLAGYVKSVSVDIGDRVRAGQVLAELDVPEVAAEAQQKHAAVEQAEADRAQSVAAVEVARSVIVSAEAKLAEVNATKRRAEAELARWQSESARVEQLVRESTVTGSLRDETRSKLEAARAALDENKALLRSAEAAINEAKARLDKARADATAAGASVAVAKAEARRSDAMLGYARITAPFDGMVTRRNVDTGALTVPGGSAVPLLVVARIDRVTVSVAVPEADAALVGAGDEAKVRIPALGGRVVTGKVTRTSWALDDASRTLRAEVDLPNEDGTLRPGLYVNTTIIAEERVDALAVPAAAVVRDGGSSYCVVVSGGRARRRAVQTGLNDGTLVEVVSGLTPSDEVAASGVESLTDGQPVQTSRPEPPATTKGRP